MECESNDDDEVNLCIMEDSKNDEEKELNDSELSYE